MLLSRSKRESPIDRRRSLEGVPVLNPGVNLVDEEDGRVILSIPLPRGRGFFARFQPPVSERRVRLDEIGTFVVGLIDGERPVLALIDAFVERHRVSRREAELSIAEFLKSLIKRDAISVAVK